MLLEHFGEDWDSGVDRVGDNEDECFRSSLSDPGGEVADDSSVDLIHRDVRSAPDSPTKILTRSTHLEEIISNQATVFSAILSSQSPWCTHRVI